MNPIGVYWLEQMREMCYNTGVVNQIVDRGATGIAHGLSNSIGGAITMSHSIPNQSALKVCPNCKEVKSNSHFGIRKTGRDAGQRRSWCKSCEAAYKRANRSRYAEHETTRRATNREEYNAYMVAWRAANPETRAAHNAVNNAVVRGDLPPAATMVCAICDQAQAAHWHHPNGYEEAHWLDIEPVCRLCHEKEHHAND